MRWFKQSVSFKGKKKQNEEQCLDLLCNSLPRKIFLLMSDFATEILYCDKRKKNSMQNLIQCKLYKRQTYFLFYSYMWVVKIIVQYFCLKDIGHFWQLHPCWHAFSSMSDVRSSDLILIILCLLLLKSVILLVR